MNRRTAIETASTNAVKNQCPYVVGFDKEAGEFVQGALKTFFIVNPKMKGPDMQVLCTPNGDVQDI